MILTVIIFLITLVILVVVHELGHFLVAKRFGIKVLEFGFGLPPRAWGKKVGETLVSINWLPFGGFVRLLGEDEVDKKILKNERSFAHQKVWKRILVVVAGVLMNLILAWVIFYIVIAANNFQIFLPTASTEVIIASVEPNSPAEQAGLKSGDRIMGINDFRTDDPGVFSQQVKKYEGQSISLLLGDVNGGNQRTISLTPRVNPPANQGAIGVATSPFYQQEFKSLPEKVFSAPVYSFEMYRIIFEGFGGIFSDLGNHNLKGASQQVMGPIGIVSASNNILSAGAQSIVPYLFFVGYLSLSLSLINVVPFPGLDGGRLAFLVYEGVTRKKAKAEVEKWVHAVGLAILLGLIFLVTLSDIKKLLP